MTKVRRNLFNQEVVSPSQKAKMPRSRSVSAVEGLKRKRSQSEGEDLLVQHTRPHVLRSTLALDTSVFEVNVDICSENFCSLLRGTQTPHKDGV